MFSSTISKLDNIRLIEPSSKRSVQYSRIMAGVLSSSLIPSIKSTLELPFSNTSRLTVKSRCLKFKTCLLTKRNETWNNGFRLKSISGLSSWTSAANGTWFAYASSVDSLTRPSNSRKVGLPDRSTRRTIVLTSNPISPSVSFISRVGTGVPASKSVCPV